MREQQLSDAAEDFAKETFLQMHGNYNDDSEDYSMLFDAFIAGAEYVVKHTNGVVDNDAVYNIGFDNNKPITCTYSSDNITVFDKSKVTLQW